MGVLKNRGATKSPSAYDKTSFLKEAKYASAGSDANIARYARRIRVWCEKIKKTSARNNRPAGEKKKKKSRRGQAQKQPFTDKERTRAIDSLYMRKAKRPQKTESLKRRVGRYDEASAFQEITAFIRPPVSAPFKAQRIFAAKRPLTRSQHERLQWGGGCAAPRSVERLARGMPLQQQSADSSRRPSSQL